MPGYATHTSATRARIGMAIRPGTGMPQVAPDLIPGGEERMDGSI
ncbi:hypothetical protein [Nocardia sp. NPDC048505]